MSLFLACSSVRPTRIKIAIPQQRVGERNEGMSDAVSELRSEMGGSGEGTGSHAGAGKAIPLPAPDGSGNGVRQKIVKVSVEVRSGRARFRVGVQAQSIRRALSLVGGRYPQGEVRVAFPIEPEGFFVGEPSALAGIVGTEQVYLEAA
jgi:hypothetical protein